MNGTKPELSIIVVMHNMQEEIENTIFSLSPGFQQSIEEYQYEILVCDNGSSSRLPESVLRNFPGNASYTYLDTPSLSPVGAVQRGIAQSQGQYVGLLIDGARLSTPRMLSLALRSLRSNSNSVVTSLTFHIGPDVHRRAVAAGHSKEKERQLLREIDWKKTPYRLFEISTPGGSSAAGWFMGQPESSFLFASRHLWDSVGGIDARFQSPGGGLATYDLFARLCDATASELVMLLGEATFHQMHGGAMTGAAQGKVKDIHQQFAAEYRNITGQPPAPPRRATSLVGHIPPEARNILVMSALAFNKWISSK